MVIFILLQITAYLSYCQAQPQLNSTQSQLKQKLVSLSSTWSSQPATRPPSQVSSFWDSTLHFFMTIQYKFASKPLKDYFKAASTPHQDNIKTSSSLIKRPSILTKVHLQAAKKPT